MFDQLGVFILLLSAGLPVVLTVFNVVYSYSKQLLHERKNPSEKIISTFKVFNVTEN
jgi:hypothetical protein